jgi:AraC family transcriptional regulator
MTAQQAVSRQPVTQLPLTPPTSPVLYLSSVNAGWEGLVVQAFREPMEYDSWLVDSTPDIVLVLFAGGTMRLEWRYMDSAWNMQQVRHGDLNLCLGWEKPYELHAKTLTDDPMRTLHVHLNKTLLMRTAEELVGGDPARVSIVKSVGFQDSLLTQIGFNLWSELEQGSPAGKLYAQTAAQMLAVHLLRHYSSVGDKIKDPSHRLPDQQIRQVVDFIQAHLSQDLSLDTLAQQTGFSPYHFARIFRQTIGESPHRFVLRQRIAHAQRLLSNNEIPLAQVAIESGFAGQSHLTQAFKRYLGETPRAYRQQSSAS